MKRILSSGWLLPLGLAVAGLVLILVGQLELAAPGPTASLPPIARPTASPAATPTASPTAVETETAGPSPIDEPSPTPVPTPTPLPDDVVAQQLEIPSVGINVLVREAPGPDAEDFPPSDAAYILRASEQPGRNAGTYIFAHAVNHLFKPLWNVVLGAPVTVLMSDGTVLEYVVTEIHPNVACPDLDAEPAATLPPDLAVAGDECDEGVRWTQPVDRERLALQTSQGFNRNWGELVIIAEPAS